MEGPHHRAHKSRLADLIRREAPHYRVFTEYLRPQKDFWGFVHDYRYDILAVYAPCARGCGFIADAVAVEIDGHKSTRQGHNSHKRYMHDVHRDATSRVNDGIRSVRIPLTWLEGRGGTPTRPALSALTEADIIAELALLPAGAFGVKLN